MASLPRDLVDALASGEAVAVVGSGPSVEAGLPPWKELLHLMIQECEQQLVGFNDAEELRDMVNTGQLMEAAWEWAQLMRGQVYRDFIQRVFRPSGVRPTSTHKLILRLPFSAILTSNYDCLLEQAYMQEHGTVQIPPVYTQRNVAQLARLVSHRGFFILKVHGHVDDVETIVLTQEDYQDIVHLQPAYRAALSTIFATRTAVFIGYGLRDPDLNLLLSEQAAVFRGFGRRHYAFIAKPNKIMARSLLDRFNVTVIPYDDKETHAELKSLLSRLVEEVMKIQSTWILPVTASAPLVRCPYKFLDYFDASDRQIFFGRDTETMAVLRSILSHRLLVMFGPSGVGKTSLLRASIAPELSDRGYLVIDCRLTPRPVEALAEAFTRSLGPTSCAPADDVESYVQHICQQLKGSQRPPVLLIDQVESVFIQGNNLSIRLLSVLLNRLTCEELFECHTLLSVREDYFVRLHNLTSLVPTIFNNRYQLQSLSRSSAEAAIRKPAEFVGITCDDDYVRLVLDDLGSETIEPAHLQIVCTAVFNALSAGSNRMTKADYMTLGGAKAILSDYIPEVLSSFREKDREIACDVLKIFVSPEHQRVLLSLKSLMEELHTLHYTDDEIRAVLDTLVFHRLIRATKGQTGPEYELSHEYLVPQIDRWISDEERELRRIRAVMANERHICESLNTVIELERARFLRMYKEKARFAPEDIALIERSINHWDSIAEERSRLEIQMRQAQKMEAIGTLAGGIAHDFNNLLTVVIGNAELIRNEATTAPMIKKKMGDISRSAEHAASLTRQLLAFSRRQVMRQSRLDLNEVVNKLSMMLRRIIGEDIALEVDLVEELPLVQVDGGMIEQVILNLAINARDAMPNGGTLVISTHVIKVDDAYVQKCPKARVGRFVSLSVRDTGCGMDAKVISHLFEPFFTTKEAGKGTGLGLATVHGIVEQHDGWIEVESVVGKGTTFRVLLPASLESPASVGRGADAPESLMGTETILVVEDEDWVRKMVSQILQKYGYTVIAACNGPEAFAIWEENRENVKLLFSDIVMPGGISGFELADQIRAHDPQVKVIYTSAYGAEIMRHKEKLVEGVNFLQKPYVPDLLAKVVRTVLNG